MEWQLSVTPTMNFGAETAVHFIDRSPAERYILVCGEGDLELYDLDGNQQTVTFPDGKGYLPTTNMNDKLRFVTVADTTFVLNTEVVTQSEAITETRDNPFRRASIFVKRAVASTTYAVYFNGALAASFVTSDNTTAATALEGTAEIAQGLANSFGANGWPGAGVRGSTVTLSIPLGTVVTVLDQFGGAAMTPYTDTIQDFSDLPPGELEGRLVRVQGGFEATDTTYWVQFSGNVYKETVGYNEQRRLTASTMPHILVKTGPGTFEFRQNDWNPRPVRDTESNPDPSFVGSPINSMFLFKGRLGFLAEENMILSATALFEDLYLTTVIQQLATDPIQVAAATGRVATLRHAVPFSE